MLTTCYYSHSAGVQHRLVADCHKAGNADLCLIDGYDVLASPKSTPCKSQAKGVHLKVKTSGPNSPSVLANSPMCAFSPHSPAPSPASLGQASDQSAALTVESSSPLLAPSSTTTTTVTITEPEGEKAVALATDVANQPLDPSLVQDYVSHDPQSSVAVDSTSSSLVVSTSGDTAKGRSLSQTPINIEVQDMQIKTLSSGAGEIALIVLRFKCSKFCWHKVYTIGVWINLLLFWGQTPIVVCVLLIFVNLRDL